MTDHFVEAAGKPVEVRLVEPGTLGERIAAKGAIGVGTGAALGFLFPPLGLLFGALAGAAAGVAFGLAGNRD